MNFAIIIFQKCITLQENGFKNNSVFNIRKKNVLKYYIELKFIYTQNITVTQFAPKPVFTGHVIWEEYRNTVPTCRNGVRHVKAPLDLNPVGDMMGNKQVSAGASVEKKIKVGQTCSSCCNVQSTWWKRMRCPVSGLLWCLLLRLAFSNSRSLKSVGKVWGREELPLGKKEQVGRAGWGIQMYECIPGGFYPLALRDLASHHKATA